MNAIPQYLAGILALHLAAPAMPAPAQPHRPAFDGQEIEAAFADPDVDVELVLMADVSRSMDDEERQVQRQGYVDALVSPEVARAVREGGYLGRVAILYAEFSGPGDVRVVADWTIVESEADLQDLADAIAEAPSYPGGMTSAASAIERGRELILGNDISSMRAVIDISGDGTDSSGSPAAARDLAVSSGITINGLPIVVGSLQQHLRPETLADWYAANVIGGPGAFIVPVADMAQFGEAVTRKLVMEIAAL